MSSRTALLRPMPPASEPAPWSWVTHPVASTASWRERTGEPEETWDLRLRYWEGPANPRRDTPVVLVHGLGLASTMGRPAGERLGHDGPVYAPDFPGMGHSDKPRPPLDLDDFTEVICAWAARHVEGKPLLVGVSLGATVCLAASAREPDAFAGVVAISPSLDPTRRRRRTVVRSYPKEVRSQSLSLQGLAMRDYVRSGLLTPLTLAQSVMNYDTEAMIEDVSVPALVVVGTRDPLTRPSWARSLTSGHPQRRFAVVPGGVHGLSHERPIEVTRLVNGFLDDLTGARERS